MGNLMLLLDLQIHRLQWHMQVRRNMAVMATTTKLKFNLKIGVLIVRNGILSKMIQNASNNPAKIIFLNFGIVILSTKKPLSLLQIPQTKERSVLYHFLLLSIAECGNKSAGSYIPFRPLATSRLVSTLLFISYSITFLF